MKERYELIKIFKKLNQIIHVYKDKKLHFSGKALHSIEFVPPAHWKN
jgi:hypothetical protein